MSRDLTYAVVQEMCVADERVGKANREHMGKSAIGEASKIQDVSFFRERNNTSGQNKAQGGQNAGKCKSCGSVQHRSESCKFRNATCHHCKRQGHIRPVRKARPSQMQLKGRSSDQTNVKLNSCESNSEDEIVESDHHLSNTRRDADEACAFGLYKTETEHLSTESAHSAKPYVVNVQLGKAKVNCKMEVDTGVSRSTVSKRVYDSVIKLSLSACGNNFA